MAVPRRYTVGRAHTCDIAIAHDSVSRTHAEIELRSDSTLLVRDLNSQNGSAVLRGGREFRLGEEVVFLTDSLRFGEVTLTARDLLNAIKSAEPEPARPAPAPSGGFVRCGCGSVKRRGQQCPACGE